MAVKGEAIGKAMCEALGLDANKITRLVIDIPAGDVATVEVTMFPDVIQGDTMTQSILRLVDPLDVQTITKRYKLVDMTPLEEE